MAAHIDIELSVSCSANAEGLTFGVYSNGCTGKESFSIARLSSLIQSDEVRQIILLRLRPDNCKNIRRLTQVFYSYEELEIKAGQEFMVRTETMLMRGKRMPPKQFYAESFICQGKHSLSLDYNANAGPGQPMITFTKEGSSIFFARTQVEPSFVRDSLQLNVSGSLINLRFPRLIDDQAFEALLFYKAMDPAIGGTMDNDPNLDLPQFEIVNCQKST
jgi:hypothetical protein